MAVQINTYAGILAGVLSWMGRDAPGETTISSRFDDILAMCERRMYYGYAVDDPASSLRSDPLRIDLMETVDSAFALSGATVAQPSGFLELISAKLNSPGGPLQLVSQRTLDGYGPQSLGGTKLIAVSGTNFRFLDAPSTGTATLRYYRKLATPAGSTVNDILANYPDVYLYGCLVEAAIRTQDEGGAARYLQLYNASVAGLNARTQRATASSVPVIRVRAGMLP
ncbi:MAG: hypothetical protein K2X72_04295 [Reyranella sp.]|nr:hypothetical protein [Reyranella sp.]